MDATPKRVTHMLLGSGKGIALFMLSGITIHTLTMFLDYFLVSTPFQLSLRTDFVQSVFAFPMVPMMLVYGSLSLLIHFFWDRAKKSIMLVQEKEFQKKRLELVFLTMQRVTGLLVEHIAVSNSEVLGWIESRKAKGNRVSEKVEKPTRNIARALHSLSESAFVLPYTDQPPINTKDFEKILSKKLDKIMNPRD